MSPKSVVCDVVHQFAVVVKTRSEYDTYYSALVLRAVRNRAQNTRSIGQSISSPVRIVWSAIDSHIGSYSP